MHARQFLQFMLIAVIVTESVASGRTTDRAGDEIERLLSALDKKPPTLRDFYLYMGKSSELEMIFVHRRCREMGWIPVDDDRRCVAWIKSRELDVGRSQSFFLEWLSKRLHHHGMVHIERMETISSPSDFSHLLIYARIGATNVVFVQPTNQSGLDFGRMNVLSIDGKNVTSWVIRENDEEEE